MGTGDHTNPPPRPQRQHMNKPVSDTPSTTASCRMEKQKLLKVNSSGAPVTFVFHLTYRVCGSRQTRMVKTGNGNLRLLRLLYDLLSQGRQFDRSDVPLKYPLDFRGNYFVSCFYYTARRRRNHGAFPTNNRWTPMF